MINADLIGHNEYLPNTETYFKLIDTFGKGIVSSDGNIDRKSLGKIVFQKKENMEKLNSLMWPAIRKKTILVTRLKKFPTFYFNLLKIFQKK